MIDGSLAADGAVYLGEQRSGNLDQAYSSQIGRGDKTCQIADDPSAQRDDNIGALNAALEQECKQRLGCTETLESLAVAD